ncbi:MAG: hypothetical protein JW891_11035 [Candidatus Lokiarchaeota archaeon]|nr:hypothetical protein [Candidatus Lokiarchaeota archaeon]
MWTPKGKSIIVYRTEVISSNIDKLFHRFVEILEHAKIFMPHDIQVEDQDITIAEVGPREQFSTFFLTSHDEKIRISFKLIENIITVEMDAKSKSIKKYKKLLTPYIIRSLKKAVSETTEISQIA